VDENAKNKLVATWIAAQEAGDDNSWAIEAFIHLPAEDPDLCWDLITRIHAEPLSPSVRAILAASPLEDLLVYHGKKFFPRVRDLALKDRIFHEMLGEVWLDEDNSPIWSDFYALANLRPPFTPSWGKS
jgi:hypothetical protein